MRGIGEIPIRRHFGRVMYTSKTHLPVHLYTYIPQACYVCAASFVYTTRVTIWPLDFPFGALQANTIVCLCARKVKDERSTSSPIVFVNLRGNDIWI